MSNTVAKTLQIRKGYGMESHIIDGNNILEVYNLLSELKSSMIKNPRPVLLGLKPSECADMKRRVAQNMFLKN
jgi:TPP-dependent pyruvate/acetoin dehydrogenase alpha subunit